MAAEQTTGRDVDLAKQVILELIRAAGGCWTGKTRLYKAFYFAHLYYADREPGFLSCWPIVRMPNGPGIEHGDELLEQLADSGRLTLETTRIGPYPSTIYHLAADAGEPAGLPEPAIQSIREAVQFVSGRTAQELSELTHEHSRSWNLAKDGQELDVYIDLVSDEEYDERTLRLDVLSGELEAAWDAAE